MTEQEWHSFLSRYSRVAHLAQEEYESWLAEFEREHGSEARERYELNER